MPKIKSMSYCRQWVQNRTDIRRGYQTRHSKTIKGTGTVPSSETAKETNTTDYLNNDEADDISEENPNSNENSGDLVYASGQSYYCDDNSEEAVVQVPTHHSSPSFAYKLREWAIHGNIELTQVSKLLRILVYDGKHVELPLDARTLLHTPRSINVRPMDNGHYVHLGIKDYLNTLFKSFATEISNLKLPYLQLSFNMDGTPISTSGGANFWPILGSLSNIFTGQPDVFMVGIFSGLQKPESYNNYLLEFVEELKDLMKNGFLWDGIVHSIQIKAIICDAPAMAFVKAIKSHGGYYSCSKCYIKGEPVVLSSGKKTKIVFPDIHSEKRTDETFRARKIMPSGEDDTGHHMNKERSVLEQLPIDMIKTFPVDKMHLVDEGIVKKIINIWLGKPGPQKLQASKVTKINQHLEQCYSYVPSDFQRKSRSFKHAHFFKASECRVLLLYTGPIVLKNVLSKQTYEHFMTLSLAIRILTSPFYYVKYNEYAHSLLVHFVKKFIKLYGKQNATYNVHGLLHLAEDAKNLGPLDENSCYLYEAFIKIIKKKLHSFNCPLQQCSNRMSELKQLQPNSSECRNKIKKLGTVHQGIKELIHPLDGNKFMTASFFNFTIQTNRKSDNCVMLSSKRVIQVVCFKKEIHDIHIEGHVFVSSNVLSNINRELYKSFYYLIGNFEDEISKFSLTRDSIICKMCCLPANDENTFFVVPVNHTLMYS
ncbi:unnamed protein product [Callosobruchus maculatus]|uniref:Transposase domain-containing protein n=1 Tax=Callosobruchus maculatus TaxID=64391 RepID=A0A653DBL9_CALMS|nr:unnamed protein product [Callosobruchus maculatus]